MADTVEILERMANEIWQERGEFFQAYLNGHVLPSPLKERWNHAVDGAFTDRLRAKQPDITDTQIASELEAMRRQAQATYQSYKIYLVEGEEVALKMLAEFWKEELKDRKNERRPDHQ